MRQLYRSPNGDSWFLARDPATGTASQRPVRYRARTRVTLPHSETTARGAGTFRYSKNRRYAGINRASRSLYSIWRMLNTWLTNGDEALQRVWGLVSIDGVAEEWTA